MPGGRNAIAPTSLSVSAWKGRDRGIPYHPQNLLAELWINCAKAAAAQRSGGLAGAVQFLFKGAS
jgi:hypothetical protein